MPAFHPKQEGPGSRDAADFPSHPAQTADVQLPSESQATHPKEKLSDLHNKEHSGGGKRAPAPDLVPLDLSERSTRDDPSHKEWASSLQAALAVHPCPYCSHKTYYPEVLWMHKRIWHRVSCHSMAPQWIQPNGYKSIRNSLVFLTRSGRTGPPPALGGKECQPLPISRFTRTQVPGGAPGPKGSPSPLGVPTKAAGLPRSKESHPGGPCALWAAGPDGHRQTKPGPGPGPEQPGAPPPPSKPKQEAGPRPGPAAGSGGFSRSATPTPTVIARAAPQPPASSRQGDKYGLPPAGAGLGPPNKHSALDPPKAKFSPQPQGQAHGKGDGGPPLPPREPPAKVGSRGTAASQAQPVLHNIKQEPASEGPEKRLDILNIFKTYIPKDFASLYQSWGGNGPALEHRGVPSVLCPGCAGHTGTLRTPAHQGDLVCGECGKCFHQSSHLRAHTRAHTVLFESNGLRGAEAHATSADAPKQGRDHSNADTVQTVPLRKGT
ncbi:zinc finger protein 516-like [Neophocaena asiaeorientalis asiaeorientalis]|uniref:Zinc finger protein 516-like n=1 Tax=Neophocaena asiaeorientalis asiaeorientalis TaxID=1706337 RepID=A0A341C711_NEOAA|nr:zinc finger protein 516-like [Neophocaena asiaeorientalis asiaeorientalis]